MKKLAIVIPNYGRMDLLNRLLNETVTQIKRENFNADVQICVCDDHSNEDPSTLVNAFIQRNPDIEILYKRKDENEGMSKNFYDSVFMADSKYCWIIGNDDLPVEDGIKTVLSYLAEHCDVDFMITPFDMYGYDDRYCGYQLPVYNPIDRVYDTSINTEREALLSNISHNCGMFGYLSNVVFRREIWVDRQGKYDDKMDNLFIQMFMNLDKLLSGAKYGYTNQKIIKDYLDDDTNNTIERTAKILFGLDEVVDFFFDGDEKKHFKKDLTDTYITGFVWDLQNDHPYKKRLLLIESEKNSLYKKYFVDIVKRKERFAGKSVIIYGAGDFGKKAFRILQECGANIIAIADSSSQKVGTNFERYSIVSVDEIKRLSDSENATVVVANLFSLIEMVRKIESLGIKDIAIVT